MSAVYNDSNLPSTVDIGAIRESPCREIQHLDTPSLRLVPYSSLITIGTPFKNCNCALIDSY